MEDKNILSKLRKREFRLNKIVANRIDKEPKDKIINIDQNIECKILKKTKENLSAKVDIKVFVDPEALFAVDLEYKVEVMFKEEVTDEEIESNIDEIIAPLGPEVSYIIASLTKKMFGGYIILPPKIKVDKINELDK